MLLHLFWAQASSIIFLVKFNSRMPWLESPLRPLPPPPPPWWTGIYPYQLQHPHQDQLPLRISQFELATIIQQIDRDTKQTINEDNAAIEGRLFIRWVVALRYDYPKEKREALFRRLQDQRRRMTSLKRQYEWCISPRFGESEQHYVDWLRQEWRNGHSGGLSSIVVGPAGMTCIELLEAQGCILTPQTVQMLFAEI